MAVEAILRQDAGIQIVDYTASGDMLSGQVVQLSDTRGAVIVSDIDYSVNSKGAAYTTGQFDVLAASGTTFSEGASVYWDNSGDVAIGTAGEAADFYIGKALEAKVNGTTRVLVDWNAFASEDFAAAT